MMSQVVFASGISVIAMRMRNYGIVYRLPRVDIKFTLGAANTFIGKFEQRLFWHM
jgi:hypothetical protein